MAHYQDYLNRRERNPFSDPKHFEKVDRAKSFSRKRRNRNIAMIIASAVMLFHGVHGMIVASHLGQSFNAWNQNRLAAKQAEQQRLAVAAQAQKDRLTAQQLIITQRILEKYDRSRDFPQARAASLDLDIASDNAVFPPTPSGRRYIPNIKMINTADFLHSDNIKVIAEPDGRLSIIFDPIQPSPPRAMPVASAMLPFQVASLSGNQGR